MRAAVSALSITEGLAALLVVVWLVFVSAGSIFGEAAAAVSSSLLWPGIAALVLLATRFGYRMAATHMAQAAEERRKEKDEIIKSVSDLLGPLMKAMDDRLDGIATNMNGNMHNQPQTIQSELKQEVGALDTKLSEMVTSITASFNEAITSCQTARTRDDMYWRGQHNASYAFLERQLKKTFEGTIAELRADKQNLTTWLDNSQAGLRDSKVREQRLEAELYFKESQMGQMAYSIGLLAEDLHKQERRRVEQAEFECLNLHKEVVDLKASLQIKDAALVLKEVAPQAPPCNCSSAPKATPESPMLAGAADMCSGTRTPGHSDSGDDGDEEEEEESSAFFNEPSNCLSLLGAFNKLSISGIKPEAKRRRVKVQKQGLPQAAATTTSAAVEAYLAASAATTSSSTTAISSCSSCAAMRADNEQLMWRLEAMTDVASMFRGKYEDTAFKLEHTTQDRNKKAQALEDVEGILGAIESEDVDRSAAASPDQQQSTPSNMMVSDAQQAPCSHAVSVDALQLCSEEEGEVGSECCQECGDSECSCCYLAGSLCLFDEHYFAAPGSGSEQQ